MPKPHHNSDIGTRGPDGSPREWVLYRPGRGYCGPCLRGYTANIKRAGRFTRAFAEQEQAFAIDKRLEIRPAVPRPEKPPVASRLDVLTVARQKRAMRAIALLEAGDAATALAALRSACEGGTLAPPLHRAAQVFVALAHVPERAA